MIYLLFVSFPFETNTKYISELASDCSTTQWLSLHIQLHKQQAQEKESPCNSLWPACHSGYIYFCLYLRHSTLYFLFTPSGQSKKTIFFVLGHCRSPRGHSEHIFCPDWEHINCETGLAFRKKKKPTKWALLAYKFFVVSYIVSHWYTLTNIRQFSSSIHLLPALICFPFEVQYIMKKLN